MSGDGITFGFEFYDYLRNKEQEWQLRNPGKDRNAPEFDQLRKSWMDESRTAVRRSVYQDTLADLMKINVQGIRKRVRETAFGDIDEATPTEAHAAFSAMTGKDINVDNDTFGDLVADEDSDVHEFAVLRQNQYESGKPMILWNDFQRNKPSKTMAAVQGFILNGVRSFEHGAESIGQFIGTAGFDLLEPQSSYAERLGVSAASLESIVAKAEGRAFGLGGNDMTDDERRVYDTYMRLRQPLMEETRKAVGETYKGLASGILNAGSFGLVGVAAQAAEAGRERYGRAGGGVVVKTAEMAGSAAGIIPYSAPAMATRNPRLAFALTTPFFAMGHSEQWNNRMAIYEEQAAEARELGIPSPARPTFAELSQQAAQAGAIELASEYTIDRLQVALPVLANKLTTRLPKASAQSATAMKAAGDAILDSMSRRRGLLGVAKGAAIVGAAGVTEAVEEAIPQLGKELTDPFYTPEGYESEFFSANTAEAMGTGFIAGILMGGGQSLFGREARQLRKIRRQGREAAKRGAATVVGAIADKADRLAKDRFAANATTAVGPTMALHQIEEMASNRRMAMFVHPDMVESTMTSDVLDRMRGLGVSEKPIGQLNGLNVYTMPELAESVGAAVSDGNTEFVTGYQGLAEPDMIVLGAFVVRNKSRQVVETIPYTDLATAEKAMPAIEASAAISGSTVENIGSDGLASLSEAISLQLDSDATIRSLTPPSKAPMSTSKRGRGMVALRSEIAHSAAPNIGGSKTDKFVSPLLTAEEIGDATNEDVSVDVVVSEVAEDDLSDGEKLVGKALGFNPVVVDAKTKFRIRRKDGSVSEYEKNTFQDGAYLQQASPDGLFLIRENGSVFTRRNAIAVAIHELRHRLVGRSRGGAAYMSKLLYLDPEFSMRGGIEYMDHFYEADDNGNPIRGMDMPTAIKFFQGMHAAALAATQDDAGYNQAKRILRDPNATDEQRAKAQELIDIRKQGESERSQVERFAEESIATTSERALGQTATRAIGWDAEYADASEMAHRKFVAWFSNVLARNGFAGPEARQALFEIQQRLSGLNDDQLRIHDQLRDKVEKQYREDLDAHRDFKESQRQQQELQQPTPKSSATMPQPAAPSTAVSSIRATPQSPSMVAVPGSDEDKDIEAARDALSKAASMPPGQRAGAIAQVVSSLAGIIPALASTQATLGSTGTSAQTAVQARFPSGVPTRPGAGQLSVAAPSREMRMNAEEMRLAEESRRSGMMSVRSTQAAEPMAKPEMFSALQREVSAINANQMTGSAWMQRVKGLLNQGKVKNDEVEWTGLGDFLELNKDKKIPKSDIDAFLATNGVKVHAVRTGATPEEKQRAIDLAIYEWTKRLRLVSNEPRRLQLETDLYKYATGSPADPQAIIDRYGVAGLISPDEIRRLRTTKSDVSELSKEMSESAFRDFRFAIPEDLQMALDIVRRQGTDGTAEAVRAAKLLDESGYERGIGSLTYLIDSNRRFAVGTPAQWEEYREPGGANYRELVLSFDNSAKYDGEATDILYESPHWQETYVANPLAHIRMDDRFAADGSKVLFIEELQSDWATDLRKEKPGVEKAPFVEKTDGWLNLSLKHVLLEAIAGEYDRVSFVSGDQSADRYDLSKLVDRIVYQKNAGGLFDVRIFQNESAVVSRNNLTRESLENLVGKSIADDMVAGEGNEYTGSWKEMNEPPLSMGGEGMREFYDKIVPAAVNKLLKKVGGGSVSMMDAGMEDNAKQLSFDVTPEMRDAVRNAGGLPMFSQRRGNPVIRMLDSAYAKALDEGDMETAASLVAEAARAAGFTQKMFFPYKDNEIKDEKTLTDEDLNSVSNNVFLEDFQRSELDEITGDMTPLRGIDVFIRPPENTYVIGSEQDKRALQDRYRTDSVYVPVQAIRSGLLRDGYDAIEIPATGDADRIIGPLSPNMVRSGQAVMLNPATGRELTLSERFGSTQISEGGGRSDAMFSRRSATQPSVAPTSTTGTIETAKAALVAAGRQSYGDTDKFFRKVWAKTLRNTGLQVRATTQGIELAAQRAVSDTEQFIRDNPKFADYYENDWRVTRSLLNNHYGRDITDDEFLFFRTIMGLTSPNTLLTSNVGDTVNFFDWYVQNGDFSAVQLGPKPDTGTLVIQFTPFPISGLTGNIKARTVKIVDDFVKQKGSVKSALDFLQEQVSVKDLHSFNKSVGYKGNVGEIGNIQRVVMKATGQDKLIPRIFVFGPKVGAYTLNAIGDSRYTTVDIWESRFIRSYFSGLFNKNTGLPVGESEHDLFTRFSEKFNAIFEQRTGVKLSPSAAQASRWFYILDAVRKSGYSRASTNETISNYTEQHLAKRPSPRPTAPGGGGGSLASTRKRDAGKSERESAREFIRAYVPDSVVGKDRRSAFGSLVAEASHQNRGRTSSGNWAYGEAKPVGIRSAGRARDVTSVSRTVSVVPIATLSPGDDTKSLYEEFGHQMPNYLELSRDMQNAEAFRAFIADAKISQGKFGAAVYIYPADEYAQMRMFIAEDGMSGFAMKKDGDIVSVFNNSNPKEPGSLPHSAGRSAIEAAISVGGKKLDCFDTILPNFYAAHGFVEAGRVEWDDSQAPEGWDYKAFEKYNGGRPDVVMMVRDPDSGDFRNMVKASITDYESAVKNQERMKRDVSIRTTGAPPVDAMFSMRRGLRGVQDEAVLRYVDKFDELRRLVDVARDRGAAIPDIANPYLGARLLSGVLGAIQQRAERNYARILRDMHNAGITIEEMDEFLLAQHAEERNNHIATINRNFPDGGSGMMTQDARNILTAHQNSGRFATLDRFANRWRSMLRDGLAMRRDNGLISQQTFDNLMARYKRYVPLRGAPAQVNDEDFLDFGEEGGRGLSTTGRGLPTAMGRRSTAEGVTSQVAFVHEDTLRRVERNNIGQSFLALTLALNDRTSAEVVRPTRRAVVNGQVRVIHDPTWMTDQRNFGLYTDRETTINGHTYQPGDLVVIRINNRRLADAMTQPSLQLRSFEQGLRYVNNAWRFMTTGMGNPTFAPVNAIRDILSATLTNTAQRGLFDTVQMLQRWPGAFANVFADAYSGRAPTGSYRRFIAAGGDQVYWRPNDLEVKRTDFEQLSERVQRRDPSDRTLARTLFGWYPAFFTAAETASRVAQYDQRIATGSSRQAAALAARDITVDFAKGGLAKPVLNTWYMFLNAGLQGNVNVLRSLSRSLALAPSMLMLGFVNAALARFMGGDDDETGQARWDNLPEYEKSSNLFFFDPSGSGKHIKIPVPYGYNALISIGGRMADAVYGRTTASEVLSGAVVDALNAFNPIGGSGITQGGTALAASAVPTMIRPAVELLGNQDYSGRPIYPRSFSRFPAPDSGMSFDGTPEGYTSVAMYLNELTGGDEWTSGMVDVSPNTIQYLLGYYMSGTGRTIDRLYKLASSNEQKSVADVPLVRSFVGDAANDTRALSQQFYQLSERMAPVIRRIDVAMDETVPLDERIKAAGNLTAEEIALARTVEVTEKESARLRKMLKTATPEQRDAILEIRKRIFKGAIKRQNELTDSVGSLD